jgi:sigma-E factor negative regulatory protein RseB
MISVLRRPVLILSAAATIAVPGALAAVAVFGHGHVPASSDAQSANSGNADSASFAMARAQARGVQLLTAAAAAGTSMSYEGVEVIADTTVGGTMTAVATIWHRSGRMVTQTSNATALAASQPYDISYGAGNRQPEGVFGITMTQVRLLTTHYVAMYRGVGSVIGRPALIVEVDRADGSVAARFWLDERTMLPLRKDVYDTSDHLVSDNEFVRVQFGASAPPAVTASPAQAASTAEPKWTPASSPALLLKQLNGQGCLVPATLPGDLDLYAASQAMTASGRVVDLQFSDGLSAVSLFVQRGTLPGKMPGWQPARIAGRAVYVTQREITVSARGFVYTLVADAPAPTVDAVVAALPRDGKPGVMGRIGRGFVRLATLVDPFK